MPKKQRVDYIDNMRGLAIIVMMMLHTNAYFLQNPISSFIWNWGQFAVPVFIFCASYVFFQKHHLISDSFNMVSYLITRLARLLIPYYIFVGVFCVLLFLKDPAKISVQYILENILIIRGIDINWLVLLFVFFTLLMPFVSWLYLNKKWVLLVYFLISFVSAAVLLFIKIQFNYRFIMWIPWSLLLIVNFFIVKYEKKPSILFGIFISSFVGFVFLYMVQKYFGHSTIQYYNKYPPNLYHLLFCVWSTIVVVFVSKTRAFSFSPIKKALSFYSVNSYSIYFVHYCLLFATTMFLKIKFNWITFFVFILVTTTLVQVFFNKLAHLFSTLKRGPTI